MLHRKNKRKQLWECIKGYCAFYGMPLSALYDHPRAMQDDRCLIECTTELHDWFYAHMDPWSVGISNHKPLGNDVEVAYRGWGTAYQGWHDRHATTSLQAILHKRQGPLGDSFVELDFDRFGSSRGLGPLIGHGFEWCWYRLPILWGGRKRKTNPYKVAKALRNRGVKVRAV